MVAYDTAKTEEPFSLTSRSSDPKRGDDKFALVKNKKLYIGALNKIFKQVLKCG